jgi:hypothetical protein
MSYWGNITISGVEGYTPNITRFYDYFHKTNQYVINDRHFKEHFKSGFEEIEELDFSIQDITDKEIQFTYFSKGQLNFKRLEELYKITIKEFGYNRNEWLISAYYGGAFRWKELDENLLIEDVRQGIVNHIEDYEDYTEEEIYDMDEDELMDNEEFEDVITEATDEQYHDQAESLLETLINDLKEEEKPKSFEEEVIELKKLKVEQLKDICRREKIRQCIKGGRYTNKPILINNILEKRKGCELEQSDKNKLSHICSNGKFVWGYY